MNKTLKYTSTCLGLLALPLSASLMINFDTNGSGGFIAGPNSGVGAVAGSYTGIGSVDSGITTGGTGANRDINGFGNGDTLVTSIVDDSTTQNFNPEVLSMTSTLGLTGTGIPTADLQFNRNGTDRWKGWKVDNFSAGITELKITSILNVPIHGRPNSPTSLNGFPWGMATELFTAGTGLSAADFNITYTISDLTFLSDHTDHGTSSTTLPGAATGYGSAGWESITVNSGSVVAQSTNGFETSGTNADRLLIRGLNEDGLGLIDSEDVQSFYATTFEMVISPTGGGTFAGDSAFVFSFDGDRLPEPVPEPSSAFLISLGSFAFLGRRKR